MTWTMKLLVMLWLLSFTDAVAAGLAARQAFRIRQGTENRTVFEWMTAFGFGLWLYTFEVFCSVFVAIIAGPMMTPRTMGWLITIFLLRLVRTFGIWVVALTLLNGGAPGFTRRAVMWVLCQFGLMDRSIPSDLDNQLGRLETSLDRVHANAEVVADDLKRAHDDALATEGEAGVAADAAAKAPISTPPDRGDKLER